MSQEKLHKFHVRPEIAEHNRAILRANLTEPIEDELLDPEDESTTERYVPAKRRAPVTSELEEDWPGQLRKGRFLLPVVVLLLVASIPIILVCTWLAGQ